MESSSLQRKLVCVYVLTSWSQDPHLALVSMSLKAVDPFAFEFHSPAKRPRIRVGEVKFKICGLRKMCIYNQLEGSEDL